MRLRSELLLAEETMDELRDMNAGPSVDDVVMAVALESGLSRAVLSDRPILLICDCVRGHIGLG